MTVERCPVCGWPLADRLEEGCIPGNCSMRPRPAPQTVDARSEFQKLRERVEALEAQAKRDAPLVAAALVWHEATPHLYGEAARRLFEAARAHRAAAVDGDNPTE
jgi:hypothetical protein